MDIIKKISLLPDTNNPFLQTYMQVDVARIMMDDMIKSLQNEFDSDTRDIENNTISLDLLVERSNAQKNKLEKSSIFMLIFRRNKLVKELGVLDVEINKRKHQIDFYKRKRSIVENRLKVAKDLADDLSLFKLQMGSDYTMPKLPLEILKKAYFILNDIASTAFVSDRSLRVNHLDMLYQIGLHTNMHWYLNGSVFSYIHENIEATIGSREIAQFMAVKI